MDPEVGSAVDKHQQMRKSKSKACSIETTSLNQTPSHKINPRLINMRKGRVENEVCSDPKNAEHSRVNHHADFDVRLHQQTYVLLEPIAVKRFVDCMMAFNCNIILYDLSVFKIVSFSSARTFSWNLS